MDLCLASDESRVLIIYTGGTIGMLVGEHGYVPEPYFLTETLRSQTRFHDPLQDSLFSHASSVEGFRQWSSSGGSSPSNAEAISPFSPQPTLLVRSSRPMDAPLAPSPTRRAAQPRSVKVAEDVYESHVPSLVTPRNTVAGGVGKRIRYAILEVTQASMMKPLYAQPYPQWHPLLDSSNIEIEGRARARPCSQASDPISFSW